MSAYKCPVCNGTGLVPNGFYTNPGQPTWSTASITPEECRTCNGRGIVFDSPNNQELTLPSIGENP